MTKMSSIAQNSDIVTEKIIDMLKRALDEIDKHVRNKTD